MKINLKGFKIFFKKIPRALAEKAFLTFSGLLVISLIFGCLTFYKFVILTQKTELKITEKPLQFEERTYENILKIWQEKEKRFQETSLKEYPDSFYFATSTKELTP